MPVQEIVVQSPIVALRQIDRVVAVIDSAPFKQGRLTPATHKEIISPDQIEERGIERVIVICAAYNAEVSRTVRARFGDRIELASVEKARLVQEST